jgi:hypothetical protein
VPNHVFIANELNWVLDRRPRDGHRRALAAATNIMHVKCPKEHRSAIAAKLKSVMEHFGIKKTKHFTNQERSIFYGAVAQLKAQDAGDAFGTGLAQGAGIAREAASFGAGPDVPIARAPRHEHQPAAAG